MNATAERPFSRTADSEIERLMPYARGIARRFGDDDEYESEALLALVGAVRAFDPSRHVPIDQWCGVVIRNAVKTFIRKRRDRTGVPRDVEDRAVHTGLYEAIGKLPEPERSIAGDIWLDEKSFAHVALERKLPRAELKRLLDSATNLLYTLLEGE